MSANITNITNTTKTTNININTNQKNMMKILKTSLESFSFLDPYLVLNIIDDNYFQSFFIVGKKMIETTYKKSLKKMQNGYELKYSGENVFDETNVTINIISYETTITITCNINKKFKNCPDILSGFAFNLFSDSSVKECEEIIDRLSNIANSKESLNTFSFLYHYSKTRTISLGVSIMGKHIPSNIKPPNLNFN